MYSLILTDELKELRELKSRFLYLQSSYSSEIRLLKAELETLKDKLNMNSSNSGLPTSKEIYKREKGNRPKSERKAGGQPGQKARKYEFKAADNVVDVELEIKSCKCGGKLISQGYSRHQKVEIPPIQPKITEYRLAKKVCNCCGKTYKSKLENYKLLGQNAESIITALSGFYNNSKREVQEILSQIFKLDISLGLVSKSEERVSKALEAPYVDLQDQVEESSYLHIDETGHYNQGKRGWCWFLGNESVSVMKLTNSRSKKVLEELLPEYEGKIISDRYGVYNYFDSENRQVCLAHLRRDFKRFEHSSNQDISELGTKLLNCIDRVFAIHKAYKTERISNIFYRRKVRKIEKKMYSLLKKVRHQSSSKGAMRVAKNILKSFDMMWLFVDNDDIDLTNNFAERQIKHHVKYRKNSYHTWSNRGDRFLERIKSVYSTAKLRATNPFYDLNNFILSHQA